MITFMRRWRRYGFRKAVRVTLWFRRYWRSQEGRETLGIVMRAGLGRKR